MVSDTVALHHALTCRDALVFPHLVEGVIKVLPGILHLVEPKLNPLHIFQHRVPGAIEIPVSKFPRRAGKQVRRELVFAHDFLPDGFFIGHEIGQGHRHDHAFLTTEVVRNLVPYVAPPKDGVIGDIKCLVGAFRFRSHPQHGAAQQVGIGVFIERIER